MLKRFSVNFAIFSMGMDAASTFFALMLAAYLRPIMPQLPFLVPVSDYSIPLSLYVIIPIIWGGTFVVWSVYDPRQIKKVVDEFPTVLLAAGMATLLCAGILYLGYRDFSRWVLATFAAINVFILLFWRIVARMIFRFGRSPIKARQVLIAGAGATGRQIGEMINQFNWAGLDLVGYLDDDLVKHAHNNLILGQMDDVREVVQQKQIEDVVIALPQRAYGRINTLISTLHDLPVNIRVIPDYFSLAIYRATVEDFGGIPMINLRDPALNDVQRLVKRIFDLMICIFLLLFVLPFILLISLFIRIDSPGPIIFRQPRVGENGRIFGMFKFRTMVDGAEKMQEAFNEVNEDGKIIFKRPNDPRITRVGHFLRRTSLDELPQLFNVILGDMSLVGPRPELPWMVDQYEPWQRKRFAVPQGMTGWWQVNGRSDNPMHLHTEDDIYYVQNYSIWMDIYILLKTPWVVLRGKGAY